MEARYLLLWLEAPLQSWGSDSKFGRRDTQNFPTKSGIYGLFLSALGAQGPQKDLLEDLAKFRQTIISYNPTKKIVKKEIEYVQTVNSPPFLMDFQMIGSGFDEKDPWQRKLIPKKSDGSAAVGGGSKMTYRYYLQDAHFAVIQELDSTMAGLLEKALQAPVYDIYLGRKNCIASDFIYKGIYDSYQEAVESAFIIAESKKLSACFRVEEGQHDGEQIVLQDVPVQFGEWKQYRDRTVTIIPL